MSDAESLRGRKLYDALISLKPADLLEGDWAKKAGVNRGFFTDLKKASGGAPRSDTLRKLLLKIGKSEADLYFAATGKSLQPVSPYASSEPVDTVSIQHIDLAYGLGATFTDSPVEIDVLPFPRMWVETITSSPPSLLTWARGRGDSMVPTIHDGDMLLLDRSQRKVSEQDALWAYTVGDTASIKRLRVKGDRFVILSDNPSVPPDEEPIDFVNIVARVIFVGKRT